MGTTSLSYQKLPHHFVHSLLKTLKYVVLIGLALVVVSATWLYWQSHACLPQLEGTLQVRGLNARVEVLRDKQGVPHLRAQSLDDLIFAQGYVTAQDRLWQMDLSRRLGEGELAQVFGERMLRLDIENRTLGFREAAEQAAAQVGPDSRKMLAAYCRGVNTFIGTHGNRLPIEFLLLRYQPRPWRESDSFAIALNMAKTLNTTWPDELMRERIRARLDPELYADLFPDHSTLDHPVAEPLFEKRNSKFETGKSKFETRNSSSFDFPISSFDFDGVGSNNWVLNGTHTQSGRPLLSNDPHLPHQVPSVWYMIHLKAPGLDVSGVSLPGLPLVIIGHNERVAWGMTNTGPDVQDLYIESFDPRDPRKYLQSGEWVNAEERIETIKVRNSYDHPLTVKVTRHGPVISHDGNRNLALRWTALEPHALRFPFLKINQAQSWREFTAALREFSGPMQNFVYADVDGNIGYYAAGWVPIRKQGDGSVPSPGSTDDCEWRGYIPFESLPHAYNPPSGTIVTANGRIVPDGYPYFITHKWEAPYRTARIYDLLGAGAQFRVADMLRIQTDIHPLDDEWVAKQLVAASAQHPPESADAQYALTVLRNWDGEARADSAGTLVCELTRRALLKRILKPKLGDNLSGYRWPMSTTFLQNVLSNRWTRWLPPGDADFDVTLVRSLEEGVKQIPGLAHTHDRSEWQWGKTIPLTFHHPVGDRIRVLGWFLNVGPFPQPGTQSTVKQTTANLGPSMRMVIDFSNLDNSVQNITLGESGQVFSPHYKDQLHAWYDGRSFPMLFSDLAVAKGTIHKLVLEPAAQP